MSTAVLFDIDGTLVDSNFAHVDAWSRAFRSVGAEVDDWRIHRAIGMDSDRLLGTLLGAADSDQAQQAKAFHTAYYAERFPTLRPLPGARELLAAVAAAGHAVVLATSAPEREFAVLREVLDSDDVIAAVTSSGDVDDAKPAPGILEIAMQRAGTGPGSTVMVGDAVWDVVAAKNAAVPCLALRSGGTGPEELRAAGAIGVWEDPADLLAHLADSAIGSLRR
ncbi:HAD family hydrolase [Curtobacterium ammoniigenes]|uniref:HAD family hydrolase n=1 Tax=Curtobacterium ammoniigenes TaxID=395387 RepID=UPI000833EFF3|nr:HAD family hydrolase [Curtobacterium ammoniigenes]